MDKKSNQTSLVITRKDIKFVTVNMLNMNLKCINLGHNKLMYLPDEIGLLKNLEELICEKN
jgi:Leucine-rich repeat (LRR) protein